MRYYLPLCPPAALLIGIWYERLRIRYRTELALFVAAITVLGLVLWQMNDDARHNANTDLSSVGYEARQADIPLYAIGVPELVLAFYLDRPVSARAWPISRVSAAGEAHLRAALAVSDNRAVDVLDWSRTGRGVINGRHFSVFAPAPRRSDR